MEEGRSKEGIQEGGRDAGVEDLNIHIAGEIQLNHWATQSQLQDKQNLNHIKLASERFHTTPKEEKRKRRIPWNQQMFTWFFNVLSAPLINNSFIISVLWA